MLVAWAFRGLPGYKKHLEQPETSRPSAEVQHHCATRDSAPALSRQLGSLPADSHRHGEAGYGAHGREATAPMCVCEAPAVRQLPPPADAATAATAATAITRDTGGDCVGGVCPRPGALVVGYRRPAAVPCPPGVYELMQVRPSRPCRELLTPLPLPRCLWILVRGRRPRACERVTRHPVIRQRAMRPN